MKVRSGIGSKTRSVAMRTPADRGFTRQECSCEASKILGGTTLHRHSYCIHCKKCKMLKKPADPLFGYYERKRKDGYTFKKQPTPA